MWSVTSLVAQAWWGRVFADLFGYSYTTLTWSTLVLSWAGILCFYGLLRRLSLPPGTALFGALVLLFNPIYLHLSYSFMSDVPFLTLVLAATLSLVRAFQDGDNRWFLIGMLLATGWPYWCRSMGMLIPLAALAYLVLSRRPKLAPTCCWRCRPSWPSAIYVAWQAGNPVAEEATSRYVFPGAGWSKLLSLLIGGFGTQIIQVLLFSCIFGLWLLPVAPLLLQLRARRAWVLPAAALMGAHAGLLSAGRRSGRIYTLDHSYSVLDSAGFLMPDGDPEGGPAAAGAGRMGAAHRRRLCPHRLVAGRGGQLPAGARAGALGGTAPRRASTFSGSWVSRSCSGSIWTSRPYDRYFLPVLPMLLIPLLFRLARARPAHGDCRRDAAGRWWRSSTVLAQADFADRAKAHWRGANQLLAQGVNSNDIGGGFEWQGAHCFDAVGTLLPFRPQLSDAPGHLLPLPYEVEETPLPVPVIGQVPYFSRLGGFTWRASYLLVRQGVVRGTR